MRPFSLLLLVLAGLIVIGPRAHAEQQMADSIRTAALRDYHGPDLEGKDGPLSKAGLELLLLYHEYKAFDKDGHEPFKPSISEARVSDGHVTIDAIASDSAATLRRDLKALGFKNAATAGRVVSGLLPINEIPALAQLKSLRGVMLPAMRTHDRTPAPSAPSGKKLVPAKPKPDSAEPDRPDAAPGHAGPKSTPPEDEPDRAGIILLILAGILVLVEL